LFAVKTAPTGKPDFGEMVGAGMALAANSFYLFNEKAWLY